MGIFKWQFLRQDCQAVIPPKPQTPFCPESLSFLCGFPYAHYASIL